MPDEPDFAAVVADVQLLAQTTLEPTLTTGEVQAIVRETARASTWVANTAYAFGQYVYPTAANRNGRRYRVVVAGTSHAADEPTWSEVDGDEFTDGGVTYREAGVFYGSVYDKRKAVHKCWLIKAAKAAHQNTFLRDGRAEGSDYTYLNCVREAMKYKPMDLA